MFFQLKAAIETSFAHFESRFEERCKADNEAALSEAKDTYLENMENLFTGDPFESIQVKHKNFSASSIEDFITKQKMGGEEFSKIYLAQVRLSILKP
jgi:hypothetical protein